MRYVPRFTRFTALTAGLAVTVGVAGTAGAGPALAQTTISVTVTGGGTFAANASPAKFAVTGATFTCANSTASVTINNQTTTGPEPLPIGSAANYAFQSCTGPRGAITLTPTTSTYQVAANSTTSSTGVTKLNVGTFDISAATKNCKFVITGTAPGSYDNQTHAMGMGHIPPPPGPPPLVVGLKIEKATAGCKGLVSDGQVVTFTATYALTPVMFPIASNDLRIVSTKAG